MRISFKVTSPLKTERFPNVFAPSTGVVSNPFTTGLKPSWPIAAVHLVWGGLEVILGYITCFAPLLGEMSNQSDAEAFWRHFPAEM